VVGFSINLTKRVNLMAHSRSLLLLLAVTLVSGCASYRTSSNIDGGTQPTNVQVRSIPIVESGTPFDRSHRIIQKIEVSIKKLTLFHADPTKAQANAELEKRASALGCDAVLNVQYQSGIGLTTWGYIDAQGNCAKFQ